MVFIVMTLIVFSGVRERTDPVVPPTGSSMFRLYRSAFTNRPFVLASVTYVLHTMAAVIISTTLIYYFKYYMKRETLIGVIFLVLLLTAIAFIPIWVRISRTIGKKAAYNTGMALFALSMVAIFFLRPDQLVPMYLLTAIAGVGLSTNFVLPWAIVPDTIEYNELTTGIRNEGIFYGIWSFGPKLGSAGSSLLVGAILSFTGYVPNLPEQAVPTLLGIRLVLCIIPAAIMGIGIAVLSFYPISHRKYNEIVRELARRRESAP
jgi:GPH family glycoside/pentoside/hexuronide:cation symporter